VTKLRGKVVFFPSKECKKLVYREWTKSRG